MKRILYIQYTNPAGYPPLEHSSRILADDGWQVLFLGTGALGADRLRFAPHPNIHVRCLGFRNPGWLQKVQYLYFCVWVLGWTLLWRPVGSMRRTRWSVRQPLCSVDCPGCA